MDADAMNTEIKSKNNGYICTMKQLPFIFDYVKSIHCCSDFDRDWLFIYYSMIFEYSWLINWQRHATAFAFIASNKAEKSVGKRTV